MTLISRGMRFAALVAMAVWIGGFAFYSAAVIPVLHDEMSHREAGQITRRVTDRLNLVGGATGVVWLVLVVAERRIGTARLRIARATLLALTIAILAALFMLHALMDRRLDAGRLAGFYPWHRVYLIASTVQWFVNLALLALSLRAWEEA